MKKVTLSLFLVLLVLLIPLSKAENSFTKALRTCNKYSQLGSIENGGQIYNILITLNKNKNYCEYKEKIYQPSGYQMLTCNFHTDYLNSIADSMDKITKAYAKEIVKNKIYEAKLTISVDIFENYLIDPKICKITKSKTK